MLSCFGYKVREVIALRMLPLGANPLKNPMSLEMCRWNRPSRPKGYGGSRNVFRKQLILPKALFDKSIQLLFGSAVKRLSTYVWPKSQGGHLRLNGSLKKILERLLINVARRPSIA